MNRYIRIGDIIINTDQIVSIEYLPAAPTYDFASSETITRQALNIVLVAQAYDEYGSTSKVLKYYDANAKAIWEFLNHTLNEIDGKIMRYIQIEPLEE